MRKRKWDWLLIPHVLLVLWAFFFVLFLLSVFAFDSRRMAGMLAPGMIGGLFICIPLAIVSLAGRAKKRFSVKCSVPILVLSVLNLCIGIAAWIFAVMVLLTP